MGAIGTTVMTLQRPVLAAAGEARDEREGRWIDTAPTVQAHLKQRQGGTRPTPAGMLRAHLFAVRFTLPVGDRREPDEGWRLRAEDGTEYIVRDCVRTGRMIAMSVERI